MKSHVLTFKEFQQTFKVVEDLAPRRNQIRSPTRIKVEIKNPDCSRRRRCLVQGASGHADGRIQMSTFAAPSLLPLLRSHESDGLERDLKAITTHLFETYLRNEERELNVMGVPHLRSFKLIERRVKADGLAIYRG